MGTEVTVEEALAFVSAPTGASGVIRFGAGIGSSNGLAHPQMEMVAVSSSRTEQRFSHLFKRAIAPSTATAAAALATLGLGLGLGAARQDPIVIVSSSDKEGSFAVHR